MRDSKRLPEIDAMKAAAILTVVFIHSLRASWDPGFTYAERLLSEAARFAVPAFLAVSGFLYYSTEPITSAILAKRLRRILVPYLVVSLAANVFVTSFPQFRSSSSFLVGLLIGNTFGPFYYVFLLTEFVLATWILSRLPRAMTVPILVASVIAAIIPFLFFKEAAKPTLWTLRLPLLFSCWFMMGWATAAYKTRVQAFLRSNSSAVYAGCAALALVWLALDLTQALPSRLSRLSSMFLVGSNLTALYTFCSSISQIRPWVAALSDRTYAIYLLHLFFVYAVSAGFGADRHVALVSSTATMWAAGMIGSLATIEVTRRLAPRRSRDLIGF